MNTDTAMYVRWKPDTMPPNNYQLLNRETGEWDFVSLSVVEAFLDNGGIVHMNPVHAPRFST